MEQIFDLYKEAAVNMASLFSITDYKTGIEPKTLAENATKARTRFFDVTEKNLAIAVEIFNEQLAANRKVFDDASAEVEAMMEKLTPSKTK